MAECN